MTNAVLHARTISRLRVCVGMGVAEAAVLDGRPAEPLVRPARRDLIADLDSLADLADDTTALDRYPRAPDVTVGASGAVTAGRGMLIVDAVADEWGTRPHLGGKVVWFTLQAPGTWQWTATCACATANTMSPSGRSVIHQPGPWDVPDEDTGKAAQHAG